MGLVSLLVVFYICRDLVYFEDEPGTRFLIEYLICWCYAESAYLRENL